MVGGDACLLGGVSGWVGVWVDGGERGGGLGGLRWDDMYGMEGGRRREEVDGEGVKGMYLLRRGGSPLDRWGGLLLQRWV